VLLDNGGRTADRYTLFDTRPVDYDGSVAYVGFDENPYSPQGFGQHGNITMSQFLSHKRERFRALGKSVKLDTLPARALKFAKEFMDDALAAEA
jgi:hypothetical protein